MTLADADGIFPTPINTWQFNFKFDLKNEKYNKVSIDLLKRAGIDFDRLAKDGIPHKIFRDSVLANGSLFQPECHWIGFHTDHDFAYLLALLTGQEIPDTVSVFFDSLSTYVNTFHDLKVISERCPDLHRGSLNKLAE